MISGPFQSVTILLETNDTEIRAWLIVLASPFRIAFVVYLVVVTMRLYYVGCFWCIFDLNYGLHQGLICENTRDIRFTSTVLKISALFYFIGQILWYQLYTAHKDR